MSPILMTLVLVAGFGAFAYSARKRWLLMTAGTPAMRFDRAAERIRATLKYAFGQKRMPRYPLAGVAHAVIFFGFLVLLLRSLILWGRGFSEEFDMWLFGLDQPLGKLYALLKDVFAILVILGACVFLYYRLIKRLGRMTHSREGVLILAIIVTMMLADIFYDGATMLRSAEPAPGASAEQVHFSRWEPAGSVAAALLAPMNLSDGALNGVRHAGFWTHSILVLIFLNILPYSKHFHIITAIPNVYFQQLDPPGRIVPTSDLEGKVEREETLGIARIEQFSWKSILDFYTCTECGRCTDVCPASNTGKLLSPKDVTIDLRDHLYSRQEELIANKNDNGPARIDLVGATIKPEVLWACTTCRACEQECPVFITYVDKIVDMRQHLVQEKGEFPHDLATAFRGLETAGNPWNLPASQRVEWTEGLDVPRMADHPDAEWLLWIGCGPAYDEKARKTARATAQLLNEAGVSYAILGEEESCNGDPARRAGNEFLAQMMMQANVEVLGAYGVKKIITICPHCYNTFKNEYGDFGGHYEVIHHTELLAQLVAEGKLKPGGKVDAKVVYHDSCYLGRYNEVYQAPRQVLGAIPGVQLVEAERHGDRGMCCGAGGAQFFKEEEPGDKRVNYERTDQLLETGATVISSACPFCLRMLTDGLAAKDRDDVKQVDVAEVLLQSVRG